METLRDIKEALNKIPDKILDRCFWGIGENAEETVGLICMEADGVDDGTEPSYLEVFDKYPDLTKIHNLIENIKKAQEIMDDQEDKADTLAEDLQQEGITDTYFDKKKKRK